MVKITKIISRYKGEKGALMNILSDIQKSKGFLSEETLKELSKEMNIPLAKLYSAATFYSFLPVEKQEKHVIRICNSPSCYLNGSEDIKKEIETMIKGKDNIHFEKTSCIGCCNEAPAMMVNNKVYTKLTKEKVKSIIESLK